MKVPNPAAQIPPPLAGNVHRNPAPQRRLDAADLADLSQAAAKPAVEEPARTQTAPAHTDIRPQRPGSVLDIKV